MVMRKSIFTSFVAVVFVSGCTVISNSRFKNRDLDLYQKDRTVTQYFMADIPSWANSSSSGECKREVSPKYFNFKSLRDSFSFDYKNSVQFQYLYNIKYRSLMDRVRSSYLTFADESMLFYDTLEQINSGILAFNPPKFKTVSLLWIDPLIAKEKESVLKNIFNSSEFQTGHPVFVSLCLSNKELESFIEQRGLSDKNIRLASHELLTMFLLDNSLGYDFIFNLSNLFNDDQELNFFIPKQMIPKEFQGKFTVKYVKGE